MIKAKVSVGLGDYFSMNKHSKGRTLAGKVTTNKK